jgi:2'-5' RNA ligase
MGGDVRSFVAVPLPGEVQAAILAASRELADLLPLPGMRWIRKVENLHVTVKFLGQVSEERLEALDAALGEALAPVPRFRLAVRRMGAFPAARHASVLWAGVDDPDRRLAAVAAIVEQVAAGLGFAREERPFTGHVTVGRARGGGVDARAALETFAGRELGAVPVDEVHLYESRLGGGPDNEGSTYVLRARAALGASDSN